MGASSLACRGPFGRLIPSFHRQPSIPDIADQYALPNLAMRVLAFGPE
jgi:hypothetical protein